MDSATSSGDAVETPPPKTIRLKAIQELETNLTFAQNRCGQLKNQVRLIRSLYQKRQESRGGEAVEWEEDSNSLSSSFFYEICGKNELRTLETDPKQVAEESFEEGLELDKRVKTGPKDVVQIILSGMSQTVSCHVKEGNRTDSFMQTEPEIELKCKPRRIKQIKHPNKKGTKKKDAENRNRIGEKEFDLLRGHATFVKKLKNLKKSKRRHSSVEVSSPYKISELESNLAPVASFASKFRSPASMSLTALALSPSRHFPSSLSVQQRDNIRNRSTAGSISYLLPTVASSLKRVCRSRRNEFEGSRRIPFVVGKSLGKSHNLGTKIQETLSLIKRTGSLLTSGVGLTNDELELRSILSSRRPSSATIKTNLAFLSGYAPTSGKVEVKDNSLAVARTSNEDNVKEENQRLKSVLIELHDEFSLLAKKYDALRAQQTVDGDDSESNALLSKLDDELNKKENEITVIMKLYNEVNELKNRLSALESIPSYRSYQYLGQSTLPTFRNVHNTSGENVKMTQFLRRIDQFQDKLKNYNPSVIF